MRWRDLVVYPQNSNLLLFPGEFCLRYSAGASLVQSFVCALRVRFLAGFFPRVFWKRLFPCFRLRGFLFFPALFGRGFFGALFHWGFSVPSVTWAFSLRFLAGAFSLPSLAKTFPCALLMWPVRLFFGGIFSMSFYAVNFSVLSLRGDFSMRSSVGAFLLRSFVGASSVRSCEWAFPVCSFTGGGGGFFHALFRTSFLRVLFRRTFSVRCSLGGSFSCVLSQWFLPLAFSQGFLPCTLLQDLSPYVLWQWLFPPLLLWDFPVHSFAERFQCAASRTLFGYVLSQQLFPGAPSRGLFSCALLERIVSGFFPHFILAYSMRSIEWVFYVPSFVYLLCVRYFVRVFSEHSFDEASPLGFFAGTFFVRSMVGALTCNLSQ